MEKIKTEIASPIYDKNRLKSGDNIESEIYAMFLKMDLPIQQCYKHEDCRFDMIIFSPLKETILAVINVRSVENPAGIKGQMQRYLKFGIPVFNVTPSTIKDACYKVVSFLYKSGNINEDYKYRCYKIIKEHKFNRYIFANI